MRGFGAMQTLTALEVMIDEAASVLGRDPSPSVRPISSRPAARPWWATSLPASYAAERFSTAWRRSRSGPGVEPKEPAVPPRFRTKAYGVGLACVSTVFGTGSDPAFALIEITPAGRITVTSQAVEIGTGICPLLRRPARAYPRGSEIDALDRVGRENL
jgi:CO/xanthine dehydrogenase Mo-binding subunit